MSHRWYTADAHFGHGAIAAYCARTMFVRDQEIVEGKFTSPEAARAVEARMTGGLVRIWNSRVKPGDTVVHVGDFCNRGFNRGIPGARLGPEEYERMLNGKIIFIQGNHDRNNGLKYGIESAVMSVGGRLAFVQHRPVERDCEVPAFCEYVICGHVHEKWRTKWVGGVLNVNVGFDANNMNLVREDELSGIVSQELAAVAAKVPPAS